MGESGWRPLWEWREDEKGCEGCRLDCGVLRGEVVEGRTARDVNAVRARRVGVGMRERKWRRLIVAAIVYGDV